MRALLVFESMFGNTQAIAEAIADSLASSMSVAIVEVGAAPMVISDDVALLVVGGPTHAFGMSRPGSRRDAARMAERPLVSTGIGIREWLEAVAGDTTCTVVATFDTTAARPRLLRLIGTAARSSEKRLRRHGFRIVAPAERFYVDGTLGPLVDGEQERARRWGEQLGATLTVNAHEGQAVSSDMNGIRQA